MLSSIDPAPDLLVGGRYRLIESLARGGTSSVWRAHDEHDDRDVAVKILRDEGVDPALRERAGREAHVLEGIHHPNLVRVLDGGVDDGMPFMVMDLLDGDTLAAIISARGTLPVDEAIDLIADVADGLGAVHAAGVIHRDVKPGNIVCHDKVPTLVDFGIARVVDATTLTRGLVMGTASYLSPEQAQGRPLSPACDVYALTCVLYELLTGRPPFAADNPVTVALKHVQDEVVPPGDLADGIPAAVDAVVLRGLAKDPAARPADGTALAAALRASLAGDTGDDTIAIAAPIGGDGTMVMPAVIAEAVVASTPAPVPDIDLIDPSPLATEPATPRSAAAPFAMPTIPRGALVAVVVVAIFIAGLVLLTRDRPEIGTRTVPKVTDAPVADAITYLEGAGMKVDITNVASDAPEGTVIASDPAAGQPVGDDGTVELSVSEGPTTPPTTAAPPTTQAPAGRGHDKPGKGHKGD